MFKLSPSAKQTGGLWVMCVCVFNIGVIHDGIVTGQILSAIDFSDLTGGN